MKFFSSENIFIICSILSPIAMLYSLGNVSLAIILITFSFIGYAIRGNLSLYLFPYCFVLILYIFLQFLIGGCTETTRTLQYIVLLVIPFLVRAKNIAYKSCEIYRNVAFICSLFIIFQYFMLQILHIYIPGIINNSIFSPNEDILNITRDTIQNARRISGLFSEPTAHSVYVLGALSLTLFDKDLPRQKLYFIVYTLGIFCSVSSTGILSITALYIVYLYKNLGNFLSMLLTSFKNILLGILLLLVFWLIYSSDMWDLFLQRIHDGSSASNRFAGYDYLSIFPVADLIFGNGMILENVDIYLSGYPRYIYYFGILGLSLWTGMILLLLKHLSLKYKCLGILLFILNTGEATMLGFVGYLFILLICFEKYEKSYSTY